MFKNFLQRLGRRPLATAEADELELAPLTVFAIEPEPAAIRPAELIDIDNLFFPWLLDMGEPVAQELNEEESRILRALKREADTDSPATVDLIPRIPSIIPLLLRSLRDRNVSNAQLANQVSQDAVLVAAVLKQVNSSHFHRTVPVRTIEEAIALIGQNGLRILVASVAFKPLFSPGLGYFTARGTPRAWELSEPYQVACRFLARRREVDEFELFLAGLLQNVGAIVALRVMDQAGVAPPGELRSLAFYASFIHYARRLACLVGRAWEFPPRAVAAIEGQVLPEDAELAEVLWQADRVAKVRLLTRNGLLPEEHAEACFEDPEVLECYRRAATAEPAAA